MTIVVLLSLIFFPYLEVLAERRSTTREYKIVKEYENETLDKYEEHFKFAGLKMHRGAQEMSGGHIKGTWTATGTPQNHKKFVDQLLQDKKILEFHF